MPSLSVVFHPDAVEEAQAARQWYAERSQSAADAFLAELDHGIEAIPKPRSAGHCSSMTRRYLYHRFPFQLIYRVMNGRRSWPLPMGDEDRDIGNLAR